MLKWKQLQKKSAHAGAFGVFNTEIQIKYLNSRNKNNANQKSKNEGGGDITDAFKKTIDNYRGLFLSTKKIPTLGEAREKIVLLCRFDYTGNGIYLNNGWEDNKSFCIKLQTESEQKFYIADEYNASGQKKLEAIFNLVKVNAISQMNSVIALYSANSEIVFSGFKLVSPK